MSFFRAASSALLRRGRCFSSTQQTPAALLTEINKMEIERMGGKERLPHFSPGDIVRFELPPSLEKDEKRKPAIVEGLVICRRNRELGSTFIVRSFVLGVGVERTIPLYSPFIRNFQVIKRQRVRRAKLYYVRKRGPAMEL